MVMSNSLMNFVKSLISFPVKLIHKSSPATGLFPNSYFGIFVAKDFLIRILQLWDNKLVYPKKWMYKIDNFYRYHEDARGGKGYFEIKVFVTFSTSASFEVRSACALLQISCDDEDHLWKPNHCGSYICVDGSDYFEVLCDYLSGNIEIGKEGFGSHVPESFKDEAKAIFLADKTLSDSAKFWQELDEQSKENLYR